MSNPNWVGELISQEAASRGRAVCVECGRTLPPGYLHLKSVKTLVCSRCSGVDDLISKKCDHCQESNSIRAKVCRNCGMNFHKGGKRGGGKGGPTKGPEQKPISNEERARQSGLPQVNIVGGRLRDHGIGDFAKTSKADYKGLGQHGRWAVSSRMDSTSELRSAIVKAGYVPKFETRQGDSSVVVFDE